MYELNAYCRTHRNVTFLDGGAFPEIHVAQHPLGMGVYTKETPAASAKGGVLSVRLDETGKIKYDAIVRQGQSKDKVIFIL